MTMIKSAAKKIVSSTVAFAMSISMSVIAVGAGALGITAISATGVGISAANAAPVNVVSNGWTLTVPDLTFSSSNWIFVLTPNSPNFFDAGDSVNFTLKDSKGKSIGSSFEFTSTAKKANLEFEISVYASSFSTIDTEKPLTATAAIDRGFSSKLTDLNLTFSVPTTSFPKRPATYADYLSFSSDLTTLEMPFPKECEALEFKFTINDPFSEISDIDFSLTDAKGEEIASESAYSSEKGEQKGDFSVCGYSIKDTTAPFSIAVVISFDDETGKSNLSKSYKILNSKFPKRPVVFADYITMKTDFATKEIPYPKSCTPFEYQYDLNDPYDEVSSLDFSLLDGAGKTLASDFDFASDSATQTGSISLCDFTIAKAVGPFSLKATVKFSSSSGKPSVESVIPVKIENPAVKHLAALNAQGVVCVKGTSFSVAKSGKCPSGAKVVSFSEPTDIQWNTLTRSPAQVKGKNFVIFGCVAQFDANTGGSKFRAYASKTPTASWLSGVNSMFSGNAKTLLKLKEDDAFIAKVNVVGAISYSTIGNKTSVPSFAVRDFVKIGTC
jgi:hypothetical protein